MRTIKSEGKRGAYLLISDVCKLCGARPVFDGDSRSVRVCSLNRYEDLLELSFGKNLTAIDRKEDAENIVTRLYVEGEYSDSGYVGIDEVNPTGLPFLLDFSYFRELGVFTDAHQAALDAYLRDVRTAKADSSESSTACGARRTLSCMVWRTEPPNASVPAAVQRMRRRKSVTRTS